MDSFVLTLAEARVMYRRYHSLLEKGRKRLPGGEFWKELGTAFHGSGASPEAGRRRFFSGTLPLFPGKAHYGQASPRPAFCSESFLTGRKSHPVPLVSGRVPGIRTKGGAAAEGSEWAGFSDGQT